MTMETKLALFGGVVPGAITLGVLVLVWRVLARAEEQHEPEREGVRAWIGPVWAGPVLVAVALVLGDYTKHGWPTLWPDSNVYRYPHALGVFALAGLIEAFVRLPVWGAWCVRAVAFAGVFWMLAEGYHPGAVPTPWFVGLMGAGALGGATVATMADRGAALLPGWRAPALVAVLFAGAGPIVHVGGLSYGMHAAAPMIAFGVAGAIAGLIAPRLTLERGAMTAVVGVVYVLMIGAGVQTEALSVASLVALGLAPGAFGLAWFVRTRRPMARVGIVAAGLIVLLGVSLGLAMIASGGSSEEEEYDPFARASGAGTPRIAELAVARLRGEDDGLDEHRGRARRG